MYEFNSIFYELVEYLYQKTALWTSLEILIFKYSKLNCNQNYFSYDFLSDGFIAEKLNYPGFRGCLCMCSYCRIN